MRVRIPHATVKTPFKSVRVTIFVILSKFHSITTKAQSNRVDNLYTLIGEFKGFNLFYYNKFRVKMDWRKYDLRELIFLILAIL